MQAIRTPAVLFSALFLAALGASACYPKSGPAPGGLSPDSVTWASEKWPGSTPESLTKGHDAFIAKCNGCHDYPDLAAVDDEKWPRVIDRMGNKVDLDAGTKEAMVHFVLAARHH
jgi:hypothetical protein